MITSTTTRKSLQTKVMLFTIGLNKVDSAIKAPKMPMRELKVLNKQIHQEGQFN
jgi:hypothetical protein